MTPELCKVPCGGCGETDSEKSCINCRHQFSGCHSWEGIGFLQNTGGQVVALQCRRCGEQLECSWSDYESGKFDPPRVPIMSKTTAVNLHDSGCDAYIGRGSGQHMNNTPVGKKGWLGNPYPLTSHSREESISLFRRDFYARLENDVDFAIAVRQLAGKRLGCFCKPLACHGDVIAEYVNMQ